MLLRRHRGAVAWLLVGLMISTPALTYAQPPGAAAPAAAGVPSAIDLGYVTPETVAAVVLHPRRVLTAAENEMLPIEVISAAGVKELGVDPLDIEQLLVVVEPPLEGPPQVAAVLRLAKPLAQEEVFAPLWQQTAEAELNGKKYRQAQNPMALSIFRPDDRTLILAHDPLLRKLLGQHAQPPAGEMSQVLSRISQPPDALAVLLVGPLRPLMKGALNQVPLPPPLAGVEQVPDLLNLVGVRVNLTGDMAMALTLRAESDQAAAQLDALIGRLLETARQAMLTEVAKQGASPDPVEQAAARYAQRISSRLLTAFRPQRNGSILTLGTKGQGQMQVATIGVLVALLLPAIQAAREAARLTQSSNNL